MESISYQLKLKLNQIRNLCSKTKCLINIVKQNKMNQDHKVIIINKIYLWWDKLFKLEWCRKDRCLLNIWRKRVMGMGLFVECQDVWIINLTLVQLWPKTFQIFLTASFSKDLFIDRDISPLVDVYPRRKIFLRRKINHQNSNQRKELFLLLLKVEEIL